MEQDSEKVMSQEQVNSTSGDDSSEDDENAELLTEELEEGFFKVLSQLKKKDLKLYEDGVKFFSVNTSEGDALPDLNTGKTKKKWQRECRDWLKGEKEKVKNVEVKEELEALHDYWTDPALDKNEKFLRDYILDKTFLEPDNSFNIEEEMKKLSEEENEVEEQLRFEHKYNFRFENQNQEQVENKSKRKKKEVGKEDLADGNREGLHHKNSSGKSGEELEGDAEETKTEAKKKKRKKKRSSVLDNKTFEEVEGDLEGTETTKKKKKRNKNSENGIQQVQENKPEKFSNKKDHEQASTEAKHKNSEKSQADMFERKKPKDSKSRKRKRHNSVKNNEDRNVNRKMNNADEIKADQKLSSKKIKKVESSNMKQKLKQSESVRLDSTVPKDEQLKINKLPRNLQMKNKIGKNKMRHRNREKLQKINNLPKNLQMKNKKGKIKFRHRNGKKTLGVGMNGDAQTKYTTVGLKNSDGSMKKNSLNIKTNLFKNKILTEKKNKEIKFGKMLSKKQKAANARVKAKIPT